MFTDAIALELVFECNALVAQLFLLHRNVVEDDHQTLGTLLRSRD